MVQDDAPQGPSHIAPMAMQLFDAIARGAESTHTRTVTTAATARQRLIATYYNTRPQARGSRGWASVEGWPQSARIAGLHDLLGFAILATRCGVA